MKVSGEKNIDCHKGTNSNDVIYAEPYAKQCIYGYNGDDILVGNIGKDQIFGGDGNDVIYGGFGKDYLSGDNGNDILIGGFDDDIIIGGNGNDLLYGDTGDDILDGGAGNDYMDGGLGNDTLVSGLGEDLLIGGKGHDIFRIIHDSNLTSNNYARIYIEHFTPGENKIDIRAFKNYNNFKSLNIINESILTDNATVITLEYGNSTYQIFLTNDITSLSDSDFIYSIVN